jgi:ADP-heptose:LPS heptosyltransferase
VGDDPADFGDADRRRLEAAGVPLILERLALPVLDSLLSACTVFVGNDSGPKHLAAFRGVPVVSVHGGALNWSEWGQDGVGRIITHRVPCSGCGIELVEECGKDLACLRYVTPETVLDAVREEFRQRAGACGD